MKPVKILIGLMVALLLISCGQKKKLPDAEITAIAKEAYIYGYPMVANYKAMYASAIDTQSPDYKKPFNEFYMAARVDTPADQKKETASIDTPYGSVWFDLRREPYVLTVPAVEDNRYFSVQLTDLYAYNLDYVSTRNGDNKGGKYLIAGPDWKGEKPEGIDRVIQSDTQFVYGLVRIQLMNAADMNNVEILQDQFKLQPLSQFTGTAAPAEVPPINFPAYSDEKALTPAFFSYMNFLMQFCTAPADEAEMIKRFDSIDVGAGQEFSMENMPENEKKAYQDGIDAGIADLDAMQKAGLITGADMHGTRADMKNGYLNRAYGAMIDPYGATQQEILSITYKLDSEFKVLNGENHYTIRFEKDKLPPANAFWSLTMYDVPNALLVGNTANRYHVNGEMLATMVTDPADGSVTLFIQKDSPAMEPALKADEAAPKAADTAPKAADADGKTAPAEKKPVVDAAQKVAPAGSLNANWLPAPEGDFYMVLRLYQPKEEALSATWKEPVVMRFNTAETPVVETVTESVTVLPADATKPVEGEAAAQTAPATTAPAAKSVPATKAMDAAQPVVPAVTKPVESTTPAAASAKPATTTGSQPAATQAPAAKP